MNQVTDSGGNNPVPSGRALAKRRKRGPVRKCGARTKTCQCTHHRSLHAGRVGRCLECGAACEEFRPNACQSIRVMPNGRCRMHGGKTPAGIASPAWKGGRWGKSIANKVLRSSFYAALSDASLMTCQRDVALLDAMIESRVARLKTGRPMTQQEERHLSDMLEKRQRAVTKQLKTELEMRVYIHQVKFRRLLDHIMGIFQQKLVLADGRPDMDNLQDVQRQIDLAAIEVDMVMDAEVVDAEDNDDSLGGDT